MNSTTLIPKCSSCMVFKPKEAFPSRATTSPYGALTTNSILSYSSASLNYVVSRRITSTPSLFADAFRSLTLASSFGCLAPPIMTSLNFPRRSGLFSNKCASASTCFQCSFSGLGFSDPLRETAKSHLNCARDTISCFLLFKGNPVNAAVSQGGYKTSQCALSTLFFAKLASSKRSNEANKLVLALVINDVR